MPRNTQFATVGILSIFAHYPTLRTDDVRYDRQLRLYLEHLGYEPGPTRVFDVQAGDMPENTRDRDVWIISGAWCDEPGDDLWKARLRDFLGKAIDDSRPVFGLNHGEHALHHALCPSAPRPSTSRFPRSVRNPFWSFQNRDHLFAFDARIGRVISLPRPAGIENSFRALFLPRAA